VQRELCESAKVRCARTKQARRPCGGPRIPARLVSQPSRQSNQSNQNDAVSKLPLMANALCKARRTFVSAEVICGSESVARVSFKRDALTMRPSRSIQRNARIKKEAASRRPKVVVSRSLSQGRCLKVVVSRSLAETPAAQCISRGRTPERHSQEIQLPQGAVELSSHRHIESLELRRNRIDGYFDAFAPVCGAAATFPFTRALGHKPTIPFR